MILVLAQVPPPTWLPAVLSGAWSALAEYPVVLAMASLVCGVGLAIPIRYFAVYCGLRFAKRIPTDLDDQLIRLLAGVVPLLILFGSLMTAVQVLPLDADLTLFVNRLLATVLVVFMVRVAFRASYIGLRLLGEIRDRFHVVEERTIPLFDLMATLMIVGLAIFAFLKIWSLNPTGWLASAGIVGVVVGLAARDTLANLFGGISIIADAPYKVGDFIVIDSGERGEVTRVGIRSTRVLTMDDTEVTIPNALMANQKIVNESGGRWIKSRLKLRVRVAYGTDVDRAMRLLEELAARHDKVAREPAARARMVAFGESAVDFDLQVWIHHPSLRGAVTHDLFVEIYKTFAREGIEIPFPQREVWVRKAGAGLSDGNGALVLGTKADEGAALVPKQM
jgi:MscS family membrane protein